MFQREILESKKMHEIRTLLVESGASWSAKEKKSELIDRYIELKATVQPSERLNKEMVEKPKPVYPTIEEILEGIKPYKDQGMRVQFTEDKTAWQFSIQRGSKTREDSGTVFQPLEVIKRCADILVRV